MASTSSVTSTIVSTLGGGSGIDMAALAQNLATAQFAARIDRNTSQSDKVDKQISAVSTLRSQIQQLASSVADRIRSGDMSSQPSIANAAVASVSRGTATGKGTYALEVTALASAQTLAGPAYPAGTSPVGSGSLTLRFGTISAGTFAEDPAHAAVTVTIASGATLADVAGAINASGAGVSAYAAQGADGAHLMLKGQEGAANAFVIEASETPSEPGLAQLAWTPADSARLMSQAGNAAFKLDGLVMTSASNSVADVAPGLSLQLAGTNPGAPTTIRFADPGGAVTTFMQDFTAALNELVSELNKDVDPLSGDLARDSGARALRSALSQLAGSVVMPRAGTDEPRTLSELGLATNRDGTFRLDGTRLAATLKRSPSGVVAMFTTGIYGVLASVDKLGRSATSLTDPGSLGGSMTRYSALKTKLAAEQTKLSDDQEKLRAQLITRFAGVDSRVGASRSTLSFLQNQIAAWNAQKN